MTPRSIAAKEPANLAPGGGVADLSQSPYDAAVQPRRRQSGSSTVPPAGNSGPRLKLADRALADQTPTEHLTNHARMQPQPYDGDLEEYVALALKLCRATDAEALLVMLSGPTDWNRLKAQANSMKIVVAADTVEEAAGAIEAGLATIIVGMEDAPVIEKLTQALLNGVAREILLPGGGIVVIYSGFEADTIDSISFVRLDEHLGRLTARDLKQLETSVPLETLKTVVDLAVEIGREGREGKPVGTMFVVGDTRKVLAHCQPAGFDPVKGYSRSERDLFDPRVREAIKEVAGLDGAFIVSPD
ncbi:MAG: hypothetical protein WEH44_01815, partial [Pirellulaceae bacterium]